MKQPHAQTGKAGGDRKRRTLPTRIAATLILGAALFVLASGLRMATIEAPSLNAKALAKIAFSGRVMDNADRERMKHQLLRAAEAAPTRERMEWAVSAFRNEVARVSQQDQPLLADFLVRKLRLNPSGYLAWAHLSIIEADQDRFVESADSYAMALETGAYMPKSAAWNIAMGHRSWFYLSEAERARLVVLARDLFDFSPIAVASIAGTEWREL
ncbi:MAG: hypothetical protein ACPG06_04205, partial [Alphaproteobacteria bacterium]